MTTLDAKMSSSSSVLQDLLRDHSSEIGNWSEIVNNHQDESSKPEPFTNIDHNGPFYIFVPNLTLDYAVDSVNMEVYKMFGGHKNLFAVYAYRLAKKVSQSFMLMARDFESCVQVLKMEEKIVNSSSKEVVRLEYVLPSVAPPKTFHYTTEQLDNQLQCYKNIHPAEEKPKKSPFGDAKPINTTKKLLSVEEKLREESIAAAAAAAAAVAAAAASAAAASASGTSSATTMSFVATATPAAAASGTSVPVAASDSGTSSTTNASLVPAATPAAAAPAASGTSVAAQPARGGGAISASRSSTASAPAVAAAARSAMSSVSRSSSSATASVAAAATSATSFSSGTPSVGAATVAAPAVAPVYTAHSNNHNNNINSSTNTIGHGHGAVASAAAAKKPKGNNKKKKKSFSKNTYTSNNKFGPLDDYTDNK